MRFEKLAAGITAILMVAVPAALAQPERPAAFHRRLETSAPRISGERRPGHRRQPEAAA
jgi:hypothetical protein